MYGKTLDCTLMDGVGSPAKREGRNMLETITQVLALVLLLFTSNFGSCEKSVAYADDPMNKPLDSLRVFDYDRGLCNDKWNKCGSYERTSFGWTYPGRSISELGTYPEATPYRDTLKHSELSGDASDKGDAAARWLFENPSWTAQEYRERFEKN
jgi:hypothetical protein